MISKILRSRVANSIFRRFSLPHIIIRCFASTKKAHEGELIPTDAEKDFEMKESPYKEAVLASKYANASKKLLNREHNDNLTDQALQNLVNKLKDDKQPPNQWLMSKEVIECATKSMKTALKYVELCKQHSVLEHPQFIETILKNDNEFLITYHLFEQGLFKQEIKNRYKDAMPKQTGEIEVFCLRMLISLVEEPYNFQKTKEFIIKLIKLVRWDHQVPNIAYEAISRMPIINVSHFEQSSILCDNLAEAIRYAFMNEHEKFHILMLIVRKLYLNRKHVNSIHRLIINLVHSEANSENYSIMHNLLEFCQKFPDKILLSMVKLKLQSVELNAQYSTPQGMRYFFGLIDTQLLSYPDKAEGYLKSIYFLIANWIKLSSQSRQILFKSLRDRVAHPFYIGPFLYLAHRQLQVRSYWVESILAFEPTVRKYLDQSDITVSDPRKFSKYIFSLSSYKTNVNDYGKIFLNQVRRNSNENNLEYVMALGLFSSKDLPEFVQVKEKMTDYVIDTNIMTLRQLSIIYCSFFQVKNYDMPLRLKEYCKSELARILMGDNNLAIDEYDMFKTLWCIALDDLQLAKQIFMIKNQRLRRQVEKYQKIRNRHSIRTLLLYGRMRAFLGYHSEEDKLIEKTVHKFKIFNDTWFKDEIQRLLKTHYPEIEYKKLECRFPYILDFLLENRVVLDCSTIIRQGSVEYNVWKEYIKNQGMISIKCLSIERAKEVAEQIIKHKKLLNEKRKERLKEQVI